MFSPVLWTHGLLYSYEYIIIYSVFIYLNALTFLQTFYSDSSKMSSSSRTAPSV